MLQELHILLFLGGLSVLSATLVPAQASLVMFALMATGQYAAWKLLAAACAGTVLGVGINWVLGQYLDRLENKTLFPVNKEYLQKAQDPFARNGSITLLLAGVPIIGDPVMLIAGASKINFWLFLSVAAPAKCVRFFLLWLIYLGLT